MFQFSYFEVNLSYSDIFHHEEVTKLYWLESELQGVIRVSQRATYVLCLIILEEILSFRTDPFLKRNNRLYLFACNMELYTMNMNYWKGLNRILSHILGDVTV